MLKSMLLALFCCFVTFANGAGLTAQEVRWLKAAAPVLAYSQTLQLPVDITVQPRARPGDVALALGFADGRCKLVLSLRGNPDAEQVLAGVAPEQQDLLIETTVAHELGHCWPYTQHAWHALPAGLVAATPDTATRLEEAYADLAALAWLQWRHPAAYAHVHRRMVYLRADIALPGGGHDTRLWLGLAADPARLGRQGHVRQPFAEVVPVWRAGLMGTRAVRR